MSDLIASILPCSRVSWLTPQHRTAPPAGLRKSGKYGGLRRGEDHMEGVARREACIAIRTERDYENNVTELEGELVAYKDKLEKCQNTFDAMDKNLESPEALELAENALKKAQALVDETQEELKRIKKGHAEAKKALPIAVKKAQEAELAYRERNNIPTSPLPEGGFRKVRI